MCGGELTGSSGIITSPNYPLAYPRGRVCEWTIVAPSGQQILLNVTDFALEPYCANDYLEIRNGGFSTSPPIGRYCGRVIDRLIRSHGNRMYLKFSSDAFGSSPGFRIYYDTTTSGTFVVD